MRQIGKSHVIELAEALGVYVPPGVSTASLWARCLQAAKSRGSRRKWAREALTGARESTERYAGIHQKKWEDFSGSLGARVKADADLSAAERRELRVWLFGEAVVNNNDRRLAEIESEESAESDVSCDGSGMPRTIDRATGEELCEHCGEQHPTTHFEACGGLRS